MAAENSRVGGGELDTALGPQQQGVLVTSTGRRGNYLLLQLVDNKSAAQTRQAIIGGLRQSGLPVHPLPSENGTEFADYAQIAKALNTPFYFAYPYHAWERGGNEHNNKLIRQYLPQKQDFSRMSPKQITTCQERLNDQPRRKLNYSTPNEHLKSLFSTQVVAFQT